MRIAFCAGVTPKVTHESYQPAVCDYRPAIGTAVGAKGFQTNPETAGIAPGEVLSKAKFGLNGSN